MNNLLYIGLNGYAGSGKDTVAKMLYCILNYDWVDKEECRNKFKTEYATNIRPYATMDANTQDNMCTCIAFADRLKDIYRQIEKIE
jgi:thymidylate kinase